MQTPLQITFRETSDPSGAISAKIHERVEKLNTLYNNIISCEVVIEAPHHAHHKGNLYNTRINLSIPGHQLVVSSDTVHDHAHEDVYVAVRDTFDALTRQLEEFIRIQRGNVKHHASVPQGTISILVPEKNYGRIVTPDGHDIYFHRNSVTNRNFDTLTVGMPVEFADEMGDDGLQAIYVKVLAG